MARGAYTGIEQTVIRARLGTLVPRGLVAWNVGNEAQELLDLGIVQTRFAELMRERKGKDDDLDEDDVRDEIARQALHAVLKEAVEGLYIGNYRRLLKRVLPLKSEYLDTSLKERRAAAAEAFKDKKAGGPVEVETIRTYHEPRALDALAERLVVLEAAYRDEQPPAEAA